MLGMSVIDNFFNFLIGVSFPLLNDSLFELSHPLQLIPVLLLYFTPVFFQLIQYDGVGLFVLGNVLDGLVKEVYFDFSLPF